MDWSFSECVMKNELCLKTSCVNNGGPVSNYIQPIVGYIVCGIVYKSGWFLCYANNIILDHFTLSCVCLWFIKHLLNIYHFDSSLFAFKDKVNNWF